MLIFETSYLDYPLWTLMISAIFFLLFLNITLNKKFEIILRDFYKNKYNKSFFIIVSFGLFFGFFVTGEPLSFWKAGKALKNKQFLTVEGKIENFVPKMKCSSHTYESFVVKNVKFEYSNHDSPNAYYKKVKCNGNKLKENQKIKIYYIREKNKNKIIKILSRSSAPAEEPISDSK